MNPRDPYKNTMIQNCGAFGPFSIQIQYNNNNAVLFKPFLFLGATK